MDELFEKALYLANDLSGINNTGMASVRVSWHPYECRWEGEANWSCNTRLVAHGDSPTDAVLALIDLLEDEKEQKSWSELSKQSLQDWAKRNE